MTDDSESRTTTDHETIQRWIEDRGGYPATVRGTAGSAEHGGVLRIEFPDHGGTPDELRQLDWHDFFAKFEHENLAFLYQNQTKDGHTSRFCKFVER
ncbi:hypothetical protein [Salinisphaera sp.]|uniref:hypothetical protein n=1 Tax=Salinisphaera sp. TaxID=1914330 RepID=UPI002D7699FC|nr:hypothetical protein [Salinisphaera sp.]HET7315749.1 hypothetical protein [Salinisphaera sp.]